jgi:hypothetical protein
MICPGAHLLGMSFADADGVLRDFRVRSRPISVGELTSAVAFGSVAASYFTDLYELSGSRNQHLCDC